MRVLRLLSRVAFICNICFVLASVIQWLPHRKETEGMSEDIILSNIFVLGFILSILINIVVNVPIIFLFISGKLRAAAIPVWLLVINALFFLWQMVLFIISR
jgi:hypothetical protein